MAFLRHIHKHLIAVSPAHRRGQARHDKIAPKRFKEYPALKHADGRFEIFRDKHCFVVGGLGGVNYKEYELQLEPGTKLFIYTDGVPEASDCDGRMFGIERMIDALSTA